MQNETITITVEELERAARSKEFKRAQLAILERAGIHGLETLPFSTPEQIYIERLNRNAFKSFGSAVWCVGAYHDCFAKEREEL